MLYSDFFVVYAPHEHTISTAESVAPTCTETGLTEGEFCEICGEVFLPQEEIPTIEHSIESYGARSTDPAMQTLCLAMLAYGDAANVFFSDN